MFCNLLEGEVFAHVFNVYTYVTIKRESEKGQSLRMGEVKAKRRATRYFGQERFSEGVVMKVQF